MHPTIFDSALITWFMRLIAVFILKKRKWKKGRESGWEIENRSLYDLKKCVVIAAPHTSNWDMPIMLLVAFHLGLPVRWVGKKSLFWFPIGYLMRWLGGISVDRKNPSGAVDQIAQMIRDYDRSIYLVISPEGTRSKTEQWKDGFYRIACKAGVPVACAYLDYERRRGGIGYVFTPTNDFFADMKVVNYFYEPIQGKHPDLFSLHIFRRPLKATSQ